MRKQGKIVRWDDEKGFGFIISEDGGEEVFAHISEFQSKRPRPTDGEVVTFTVATDELGRFRAEEVLRQNEARSKRPRAWMVRLAAVALFFVSLFLSVEFDRLPRWTLFVYVSMSLVSFMTYAVDKSAAEKNRWRTPENTLHLLDVLCGWPGGLIAQNLLKHKVSKFSFQIKTAFVVVFNWLILLVVFLR